MKKILYFIFIIALFNYSATANASRKVAQETLEFLTKSLGSQVSRSALQKGVARVASRYGDDGLRMIRSTGVPGYRALSTLPESSGRKLVSFFARYGSDGAVIISRPATRKLLLQYGDDAGVAMIKHPGIAEPMIGRFGSDGATALSKVSTRNAQRLHGLINGTDDIAARGGDYVRVVRQYGDEAMNFIWDNKGALSLVVGGTTFLSNPEPYIAGTKSLVVDPIVKPIISKISWLFIPLAILVFFAFGGMRLVRMATRKVR